MSKLSYKSLFIILFFLLISIVVLWKFVLPNHKVSAAWWDDGWNYRKAVPVTNTLGSVVNNQIVKVVVDTSVLVTAGKLQSNCDDIRITDINGNLLDHWDTGCNTTTTNIYFKTSSIPVSGTTIYLYYGNPSANNSEKILGTAETPGTSCKMMKDQGSVTTNGLYYVIPGGNNTDKIQVYCDTNIISDTWTLVINNGAYTIPPKPTWTDAINTVNITGTISSTNLDSFDLILGLKHWNYLGNKALIQMGSNPTTITKRAHYNSFSLNTSNNYSLTLSGEVIDLGGTSPGFYSSHNGNQFTTYDADHDTYTSNCSNSYGNTPWWYNSCWSGNIWGGGDSGGYQNKPYWYSSTTDYYNYGGIYIGGADSMNNVSVGTPSAEEVGGGPIAYWKFDEGTGTTAYDSVGINSGTFGLGTSIPTWQTENQCINGKCLYFDGGKNYVDFGNNSKLKVEQGNFTVETWFKSTISKCGAEIVDKGKNLLCGSSTYGGWSLGQRAGKTIFMISDSNTDNYAEAIENVSRVNEWVHAVGVKNGDTISLYINGKFITSTTKSNITIDTDATVRVGGHTIAAWNAQAFIDDVKIYPYARTADQIKQDYNSRGSSKGTSANLGGAASDSNLSNGLVGYWKMDENIGTSIVDSSGNSNTGTLTNVGWANGKFGVGTSYNGTNNVILVPDTNNTLDMANDFTVSFWVNPDSSGTKELVAKANGGNYEIWQSSTNLSVRVNGSNPIITASSIFTYGQWTYITVKYERLAGRVTIYQNGNYFASGVNTNTASINNSSLQIGAYSDGTSYPFSGKIDELRIYNRALSSSEVFQLYEFTPGPIIYWKFDEKNGTSAKDTSGNNNTGTFGTGNSGPSWATGKYGSALFFDGQKQYLSANIPDITTNQPFTIMAWAKSTGANSDKERILADYATTYLNWNINNTISFMRQNGSYVSTTSTNTFTINQWHHVVGVYDGVNITLYVDGIFQSTANIGSGVRTFGQISAGRDYSDWTDFFHGSIDDVKVYNYARTQKQIIEDMTGGAPATSSKSIIAYYKFDEGSGTTANNSGNGGSALNGTLSGTTIPTWNNDGKFNKALNFNGSNNSVSIGASLPIKNEATFTGWFKINSFNDWASVFGNFIYGNNTAPFGMNFIPFSGFIRVCSGTGSGAYVTNDFYSTDIVTNKWIYGTLVYNGTQIKVYINGKMIGSANRTINQLNAPFVIGRWATDYNGYYFPGTIDEVKIYNYALTDNEIKQDYNQGSALQMGQTSQTISGTTTSLEHCIPGDTSPCASPIAEWNFDEKTGTSINDSSGNNNTGTFGTGNSAPTWTTGQIGAGLKFDGVNDYLEVPNYFNLSPATFEFWFKANSWSNSPVVFSKNGAGPNNGYIQYSGALRFYSPGNSPTVNWGNPSLKTWHHATLVITGTQHLAYLDGSLVGSTVASTTALFTGNYNFKIGSYEGGAYDFNGSIDHVKIYNYARTPAQIAYDYNKGSPVGWWKLDDCQGLTAFDSSGLGNNGAISIGPSGTQTSVGTCQSGTAAAWTNGTTGKINSSLNFDGIDDYLNIGDPANGSLDFGTNDFSTTAWFKTTSNVASLILGKYNSYPLFYTRLNSSGIIESRIGFDSSTNFTSTNGTAINDGNWHQIIVVYKRNGNMTKYIDGKIYGTAIDISSSANTSVNTANLFRIASDGGSAPGNFFNGQIDDVRIYNYALTTEQIKTLYNNGAVNFQ